jgi:hypothetical protein
MRINLITVRRKQVSELTAAESLLNRVSEKWIVDRIVEIDAAAAQLPFEEFREPVAVTLLGDNGIHQVQNLDAAYLTGWSRHIAYSMRVRLRALEPGIVEELGAGRILAAQVLLRSHLEASAMAALCLVTLRLRDDEELSRLIPQTLFGTALFNKAKRDERVADMLSYSSARTITITKAMEALHEFAYPDGGPDNTSIAYALLCEAAHPNHGGTKQFVQAHEVDDTGEYGWYVTYSDVESVPPVVVDRLAELLLLSMSCGYGATEVLRNMRFADGDDAVSSGVPEGIGRSIWDNFLEKAKPPV